MGFRINTSGVLLQARRTRTYGMRWAAPSSQAGTRAGDDAGLRLKAHLGGAIRSPFLDHHVRLSSARIWTSAGLGSGSQVHPRSTTSAGLGNPGASGRRSPVTRWTTVAVSNHATADGRNRHIWSLNWENAVLILPRMVHQLTDISLKRCVRFCISWCL